MVHIALAKKIYIYLLTYLFIYLFIYLLIYLFIYLFLLELTWCATYEKGPYAICGQRKLRSACASAQSYLGIFCLSTHTTVSTDYVSGQRRPRSACVMHKGCFRALRIIWCGYSLEASLKTYGYLLETPLQNLMGTH